MTIEHKRYGSKPTAFRVDAQGADPILHPATGAVVGTKTPLVAEFAIFGPEFIPRDENGEPLATDQYGNPYMSADIRGNFWDSEVAQRENGWTDEETQAVIDQVEYFCQRQPDLVWRLEAPVLTAPWPTFDSQDDKNVVMFAIEGGLVPAALAYAVQQDRPKVVKELQAYLSEQHAEDQAEQALTAA